MDNMKESPMMELGMLEDDPGQKFQQKETTATPAGNYRDGEVRCYNCKHFKDPDSCGKGVNGGKVDAEGSCDMFTMDSGMDEDEGGESAESATEHREEPFEDD